MTYILQFVAMMIALVSQFFDSVRKDASGRQLATKSGYPILTRPGRIIIALILVSFMGSGLSTWLDDRKAVGKERHLNATLDEVNIKNAKLLDSVQNLSNDSETQSAQNLQALRSITKEERKAGEATALN